MEIRTGYTEFQVRTAFTLSLTHARTHVLTRSLTHSLARSLTHSQFDKTRRKIVKMQSFQTDFITKRGQNAIKFHESHLHLATRNADVQEQKRANDELVKVYKAFAESKEETKDFHTAVQVRACTEALVGG